MDSPSVATVVEPVTDLIDNYDMPPNLGPPQVMHELQNAAIVHDYEPAPVDPYLASQGPSEPYSGGIIIQTIGEPQSPMVPMTQVAPPPPPPPAPVRKPKKAVAAVMTPFVNNTNQNNNMSGGMSQGGLGMEPPKNPAVKVLLDQERFLPIANVVRIMKRMMDPQAKLAKDAKECVQECVSEFISFIAAEASDICHQTRRKTITADDLLTAMESTGFDNFAEPMRIFLQKYRQAHKITGPIHREHPNYERPKQFRNDPPVPPLFFDSATGRRSTETQYVINGYEVVKNAPFQDEWNELTGRLNSQEAEEAEQRELQLRLQQQQQQYEDTHLEPVDEVDIGDDEQDPLGAIALEQQGQMQIYVDPKSKQHYAAKETPHGMELYPLIIQETPLQLENVAGPSNFIMQMSDEQEEDQLLDDIPMTPSNMPGPSNPQPKSRKRPQQQVHRYRQLDDEEDEEDDDAYQPQQMTLQHHHHQQEVPRVRMPGKSPRAPPPKRTPAKRKK